MPSVDPYGLSGAVDALHDRSAPVRPEQAALPLEADDAAEVGTAGELLLMDAWEEKGAKGGRPKGSRNRKTEEFVNYLLSQHRSPLVGLALIMSQPVHQLAAELGCKPLEAFDRQMEAMKALAPYLHQKLPTAIQVDGSAGVQLVLAASATVQQAVGLSDAQIAGGTEILNALVSDADENNEKNQRVTNPHETELDRIELDRNNQGIELKRENDVHPTDLKSVGVAEFGGAEFGGAEFGGAE